ncbi:DNA alkylation repair protein [Vibrio sp. 10N]|uniref:DNA alkylation repair protein n=1 Tax=Vibrio sp. 10N TaxID=3058938 RepID=UPI0028149386|nr:DNA alkylation repair protein [Vibrio sp. 10N]
MHAWNIEVQTALQPLANSDNAASMKAYMRDQYEFYGIQSWPRRKALHTLFSKQKMPNMNELAKVVDELWALPQREYQLVAVDLLIKQKKVLQESFLEDVERWITTKSWWDTVDMLATHIVASLFQRFPDQTACFILKWRQSDNIWLRRTAILYQLKFKQDTNESLLFEIISENQPNKEFFIQKAIGWSLREYSKTHSDAVIQFIDAQHIEGLAKREGLKWLKAQGRVSLM